MKNKVKLNFISVLSLLPIFSTTLFAQTETGVDNSDFGSMLKIIVAITAFLIALVLWLVLVYAESNDTEGKKATAPFKKLIHALTQSVSIQQEDDIMLDHDFDGIKELDNKIPPWWNALFYGAIIFGIIYMIDYHVIGDGNVQEREYQEEMQAANLKMEALTKSGAVITEKTVTALTDAGALASGKKIFIKNCAACHGQHGEGLVGPNFTDDYWINGGGIKNIYHTISEGVPAKGMISWKSQLSPNQIQEVGSYILSLKGTNPPNQKGPEGAKWVSSKKEDTGGNAEMSDKGIGPVKEVTLGEIDPALVKKGEKEFVAKCSACHKIKKRFVGPALGGVTERRSPEWIMNMILNPDQMIKENPIAKKLLMEYLAPMANQNLTQDEARSILEYFRTQTENK